MKLLILWALFTLVMAFKVDKLDRWTVLLYVALCMADVAFAYVTF